MFNIKSLKTWKTITKPHKGLFWGQLITSIIPSILSILITIPSARLINNLSVYNYQEANNSLLEILIIVFIEFVFWNINYFLYPKQLKYIYIKLHNQIFDKILTADDENLSINSKEKIINILSTNLLSMIDFTYIFTHKVSHLITTIILISVILINNFELGIITISICLISYLLYNIVNFFFSKRTEKIQLAKDNIAETFGSIIDGKNLSKDLNLVDKLKEKYNDSVKNMLNNYKKEHIIKLFSDKWIYYIWKILVYFTIFYLITLVEKNLFSLTMYLIITPYLSTSIESLFNFLSLFQHINIAKISSLRIKTILDMPSSDIISFGNNTTSEINGVITFNNISFTPNNHDKIYGSLNKFSLSINKNKITLIQGKKQCGKRALFYMLGRKIKPTTGTITFDSINIYDFDKFSYNNNFSYTTSSPYFFNDSIINNLKLLNKKLKIIKNTLKFLNIDTEINDLKNGYLTNLTTENINSYLRFMIGLARSILTESEIICIYEFPIGLTNDEINNIKKVLNNLKKYHTILIFSASNLINDIVDNHYIIENGNLKNFNHE